MFLHTYQPESILFNLGPIAIYWYGLLMAIGIGVAWLVISYLAKNLKSQDKPRTRAPKESKSRWDRGSSTESGHPTGQASTVRGAASTLRGRPLILKHIENVAVWGIIIGLIGARLYHVLSELPYYIEHPLHIFMIWRGGLGIFGALAVALVVLIIYCRKHKVSFLFIADIFAPGIIIAQAIGRWGNYFNNELFGLPTTLPWGIPIRSVYRTDEFASYEHFHPTFLYESLWNIFVFVILFVLFKKIYFLVRHCEGKARSNLTRSPRPSASRRFALFKKIYHKKISGFRHLKNEGVVFALYLILYSLGRFLIEFIRIDPQPVMFGLRLAQITSLVVFVIGWVILINSKSQIPNSKQILNSKS